MSRRSAAQTRELLISTALDMLHEEGPSAGVGHIKLSAVVEKVGVTLGAAYPLWKNGQKDFHRDLAIAAVRWRDRKSTEKTLERIHSVFDKQGPRGPLHEVLRRGSEANLLTFPDDIAFFTTLALRVSAHGQDQLVATSHDRHVEAMAVYGELYAAVLAAYHRRFKPPFEMEHLCAAFAALAEGFAIQMISEKGHPHLTLPTADPEIGSEWTLLGVTVVAVLEHITEPIPPETAICATDTDSGD